jgi:hypothetical protein
VLLLLSMGLITDLRNRVGVWNRWDYVLSSSNNPYAKPVRPYILSTPWGAYELVPSFVHRFNSILQIANIETYDYQPPLPLPDPEAPEQSLGDCAICMDAITVDPALRQHVDEKGDGHGLARRTGGLLAQSARKSYSLAPCHHLFVSS